MSSHSTSKFGPIIIITLDSEPNWGNTGTGLTVIRSTSLSGKIDLGFLNLDLHSNEDGEMLRTFLRSDSLKDEFTGSNRGPLNIN